MSILKAPDRLETARLVLRKPVADDAAAIFERYASDPEVTRFLGWPRHQSVEDTEAFLRFSAQQWERWPAGPHLIELRTDGRLLGSTGLTFNTAHEVMTGYVLARDAWGRGYATEALTASVGIAREIGVTRLVALCHPDHRPSRHVLEKCQFALDDPPTRPEAFPNLAPRIRQDALCYVRELAPSVP